MAYDLWYWPGIQGRGEFVRLALEAAGVDYRDRARSDGVEALVDDLDRRNGIRPYAPPYLVDGDERVRERGAIMLYLTDKYPQAKLGPLPGEAGRGAYLSWLSYYQGIMEASTIRSSRTGWATWSGCWRR